MSPEPPSTPGLVSRTWTSLMKCQRHYGLSENAETHLTGSDANPSNRKSEEEPGDVTGHPKDPGESPPNVVATDGPAVGLTSEEVANEMLLHQAATAFVEGKAQVPEHLPPLPKPIAIPRLTTDITSSFVRAWPQELTQQAITAEDFLALLDNMNMLSNPPPASVLLSAAAIGIGFVPFEGADGVAVLAELAAIAASYKLVVMRCANFLDKVNREMLHPRGLHGRLVKTKRLTRSLGVPADDPLIAPLTEATLGMTAHDRCMERLKSYCCELSYDVAPPCPQTKFLAKLAAWNVEQKRKKFEKCSRRKRKRAWARLQAGAEKALKREGWDEKARVKKLQWLLIQNLDDFEREEREAAEELKQQPKKTSSIVSWRRRRSDPTSSTVVTTTTTTTTADPLGEKHEAVVTKAVTVVTESPVKSGIVAVE